MDLLVDMWEAGEELAGQVEYRTALFKPETIAGIVKTFERLLEQVTADPLSTIESLGVRSKDRDAIRRDDKLRSRLASAKPQQIRANAESIHES